MDKREIGGFYGAQLMTPPPAEMLRFMLCHLP